MEGLSRGAGPIEGGVVLEPFDEELSRVRGAEAT